VRLTNVTELEGPVFLFKNEYISTFQIAVNDFLLVEVVEATSNLVQTLVPENNKISRN